MFRSECYTPNKQWRSKGCAHETAPPLTVTVQEGTQVDWYDSPIEGTLLLSGATAYTPEEEGTYYAEAWVDDGRGGKCISMVRTPVSYSYEFGGIDYIAGDVRCSLDQQSYEQEFFFQCR